MAKLRHQNAILESEKDYYRQMYEKSVEQKEEVRKKAKDAVRLMRAIYADYEELQGILRSKEQQIQTLKTTIKTLESKSSMQSTLRSSQDWSDAGESRSCASRSTDRQQTTAVSSSSSSGSSSMRTMGVLASAEVISMPAKPSASLSPLQVDEASHQTSREDRHSSSVENGHNGLLEAVTEECGRLRARVTELEGLLVGTLYHTAKVDTPHRISQKDLEPFTPDSSGPDRSVSRMIEALQHASSPTNGKQAAVPETAEAAEIASEEDDEDHHTVRMNQLFDKFDKAMKTSIEL